MAATLALLPCCGGCLVMTRCGEVEGGCAAGACHDGVGDPIDMSYELSDEAMRHGWLSGLHQGLSGLHSKKVEEPETPPLPRFHPVPTRPVFTPRLGQSSQAAW